MKIRARVYASGRKAWQLDLGMVEGKRKMVAFESREEAERAMAEEDSAPAVAAAVMAAEEEEEQEEAAEAAGSQPQAAWSQPPAAAAWVAP
jgi:hypothetical protein